jgi:Asp-tRNA(Asn)/Glu-tRNA(Gln) amidotransferase A subunit family amidase
MTRTVEDAALMLSVMAGYDAGDPGALRGPVPDLLSGLSHPVRGLVVGVPRRRPDDILGQEEGAAVEASLAVLEGLGAHLVEIDLPSGLDAWPVAIAIMAADLADIVRDDIRTRPGDFGPWIRPLIRLGQLLPAADYIRAQRLRERFSRDVARVMETVDVIATPTVPYPAWPLGAAEVDMDGELVPYVPSVGAYTPPWNLTGMPALSVPCGFSQSGLPLGLQLAGRPSEDALLLRLAHAYQQATDWHERRPPVCA